ncbi:hypothetical protein ACFW1A_40100, partial [Kitasatospora sp. NPDC058965]
GAPAGGLPTREVGQSLRETPPPAGAPQQQGGRRPGAPAGGPGALPRRGAPQEPARQPAPQAGAGEQSQHGWADGRPQGPNVRTDVGPNGRPGQLPQRQPGQGQPPQGRPAQGQPPFGQQQFAPQQGQRRPQPAGDPQGPPTVQQPVLGQQAADPADTGALARPRFEASDIDPRDPLGLGLVEPVLPSVANPQRVGEARAQAAPAQPQYGQQPGRAEQFAPQQQPAAQPQQQFGQQPALPPRRSPEHGQPPQGARPDDGQQGFRTGGASRMASVQVNEQAAAERAQASQQGRQRPYQPQRPGTSAPGFDPQGPPPRNPQQPPAGQPQQPEGEQAPWRPSANDERWRRAEQLRQPTSDGVTLSGLPRRTPQANLVAGTAEAAPLTGPQVSRAPEEVRGRLTNLRRGIQQGRRAGAESTQGIPVQGIHQQNQSFDGFGRPGGAGSNREGYRSAAPDAFGTENQEH